MEQISIQELKQKLSDLLAHDALEFIDDPAPDAVTGKEEQPVSVPAILIPYMMSDEVEYYFTLTGATITGTIPHSLPSGTILRISSYKQPFTSPFPVNTVIYLPRFIPSSCSAFSSAVISE